ncbi:MAG: hypothetical protein PHQ36_01370 [Anaerolineales bacterium]|nr:hypothetical protein [Anaerolineales bacterium]
MLLDASIVLAALVIASIVYFYFRDQEMIGGLKEFLKEGQYKSRIEPPIKTPFIYKKLFKIASYDGRLKTDMPYTLILGIRAAGEGKDRVLYQYVGFYLQPQNQLSDEWLNGWKHKVAERGDGWAAKSNMEKIENIWGSKGAPDNLPIRADRVNGGVILAWNGLHTREHIEARINDVMASL